MEELETLKRRLSKIGIEIEFISNIPWVYLWKVNNRLVLEEYMSRYGFTLAFITINKDKPVQFANISKTFETIRKYSK